MLNNKSLPRKRVIRRTRGKDPRVLTGSLITSAISGGIGLTPIVIPTEVVGTTGTGHVFEGADTKSECAPNSVIKYFNLRLQTAIKSSEAEFRPGWVEYGLVQFENQTSTPVPSSILILSDFLPIIFHLH